MNIGRLSFIFIVLFIGIISSVYSSEEILLRHRFVPGLVGQIQTDVMMKGDSFISGDKAATDMKTRMLRELFEIP